MSNYLTRQIKAIEDSRGLQFLGACFAAVHLVIFLSGMITNWWIPYFLSSDSVPSCWALFPNCYRYRLSFETWKMVWYGYGLLAAVGAGLFLFRRVKAAYWLLLFLTFFEAFIGFSDYRVWYPNFYISLFVAIAFLFLKPQLQVSAIILALCYWWSALQKMNTYWLSGDVLRSAHWAIFPQWDSAQATFVVFMEFALVWLLFSKRPKIFWPTLTIFVIFHLLSLTIIDFFFPVLMLCLLPVFVLQYFAKPLSLKECLRPGGLLFLIFFCVLQMPPYFQSEQATLRGGWRMLYSLQMFHRHIICHTKAYYLENGLEKKVDLREVAGDIAPHLTCMPLVSFNAAKYLCRSLHLQTPMRVEHWAWYDGDEKDQELYHVDDFCNKSLRYDVLGRNSWFLPSK
jgi:hypothetical protein